MIMYAILSMNIFPDLLQGELKLTVLISWDTGKGIVHSHVAELPLRPKPPVKVQVQLLMCV